jgi:hypothetical protein
VLPNPSLLAERPIELTAIGFAGITGVFFAYFARNTLRWLLGVIFWSLLTLFPVLYITLSSVGELWWRWYIVLPAVAIVLTIALTLIMFARSMSRSDLA